MEQRPLFFGIRLSKAEREALDKLAEAEERVPSDLVRRMIRQAAAERFGRPAPAQQEQATA